MATQVVDSHSFSTTEGLVAEKEVNFNIINVFT